jgi:methylglutaconyl-CoA hydratase
METNYQTLIVKKLPKGIWHLSLNRPELHNAFNEDMIVELSDFFTNAQNQTDLRAIVLSGEGKSFCAGADLNWMKKMVAYTREENFEDAQRLAKMLEAIDQCPVPLIGKIHGAALGGGVGLMSVCDYVVAESNLVWGLTEVKLGLLPAVISPFVMNKIGVSWARALFTSGMRMNALRGQQMGLIHEVVSADQLQPTVELYLEQLMSCGPKALRESKALIRGVLLRQSRVNDVRDYTAALISGLRASSEGQEGMNALLEKRKPQWN